MRTKTIVNVVAWTASLAATSFAADPRGADPPLDPPAVRSPSALGADAADGQTFLEWNPGLEETLAGYRVYRRAPEGSGFEVVTPAPIEGTTFTDTGLANVRVYRYRVASVLRDGRESEPSNEVAIEPRAAAPPQVIEGPADIQVPGFERIRVARALTILFENGLG